MNQDIRKKEKKTTPVPRKKEVHKGYNEKNPTQPQGAFLPDNVDEKSTSIDNKAYKTDAEAKKWLVLLGYNPNPSTSALPNLKPLPIALHG